MKQEFDIKKRTYQFSLNILNLAKSVKRDLENDILLRQLIRCVTSVGANIHESKEGHTKKDFVNFHSIALKSANETAYWLRLLKDTNSYLDKELNVLLDEAEQLAKIIAKIRINASK